VLADLLEKHSGIVSDWSVSELDHDENDIRLKVRVTFFDGSVLNIRQVVLDGVMLKYAYHWQTKGGDLILRWDNARHWESVSTHPHHKHSRDASGIRVLPSAGGDLSLVLDEIATGIGTA
jgi:hypothetical protein